jgi:hypothetical protein
MPGSFTCASATLSCWSLLGFKSERGGRPLRTDERHACLGALPSQNEPLNDTIQLFDRALIQAV